MSASGKTIQQNHQDKPASKQARTAKNWSGLFSEVPEIDCELNDIEGNIPDGLVGSLYKNGPGSRRFSSSFFDGDGMIRAMHISACKKVTFKTRFVETTKFKKEKGSKVKLVRTAGTNLPGGIFKNAFRVPGDEGNTHVFHQNGKLLACEEGGHPWIMDPATLATEGEENFSGALPRRVAFSAHPHYDTDTKDIYNFGMVLGKSMRFQCFKIDQQQKLTMLASFASPKGSFVHDFALSSKWMTFVIAPLTGSLGKFILGIDSLIGTMKWHTDWATQVVMVPRDGGKAKIIEMPSFGMGHVVSSWDDGNDVVVDLGYVPDFSIFDAVANYDTSDWQAFGDGVVSRLRINTKTFTARIETFCDLPAEFPRIHPKLECKKPKWAYFGANTRAGEGGLYKASLKLNMHTGETDIMDFGDDKVSLEPIFIPKPDAREEDDGWVIDHVYDNKTGRTDVVILDARCLNDGPICTIHLPINTGTSFHGTWVQR